MTSEEAISLLAACKPLAERVSTTSSTGAPINYTITQEDLEVLQGFDMVQNDPLVAGPGLLNRLLKSAGLTQVEVYKLDQLRRLLSRRRYQGRIVSSRYKSSETSS
jgi:hypothetical protein